MTESGARFRNPLIIDVEASGLGAMSYPIEIGLAMEAERKYCTLILPAPDWTHWDKEAERVHRVARDILETYGKPLREVTGTLNEMLSGCTVFTDGWVVDKPWLTTLYASAGMEMSFHVSPLEAILTERQMSIWYETRDRVITELNVVRHRASYDAWIIQETYRRTLQAGSA